MNIVRFAIEKPVTVTVGVLLLVMFGLVSVSAIPIQLTPTIDRPVITVTTVWVGRSPQEIVDQITKEQEERVKSVSNLRKMSSSSNEGSVTITLEFVIGTDMGRALQEVSDALRQVPAYPEEVDEPIISVSEGAAVSAIAWIVLDVSPEARARHADFDISTLHDVLDKRLKPFLERVEGVAQVNIFGGREREVRVLIDTEALARRGLNHLHVLSALRGDNINVSAGTIAEGKRDYRVRVIGQFDSAEDVLDTLVSYRGGKPVYVRDVATVEIGYEKRRGFVRADGTPAVAINVIRQSGSNVMSVMAGLREQLDVARKEIVPGLDPVVGPDLRLRQVYDETTYISSAIDLVIQNLWIGGSIAALVLLLFLRSFVSTVVIGLAIPVSIIGTFLVMLALGRTINVVSLAGLAFAVGMVVDNAIVVLENIARHQSMAESPGLAAERGGREVWGAIVASTLTTVAVLVPILTIREEAGQLFRDISLAIASSVVLSLVVSVTVIPSACSRWMRMGRPVGRVRRMFQDLFWVAPAASWLVRRFGDVIHWLMTSWRGWTLRPMLVVVLTFLSLYGAVRLAPPMDYLPKGNMNFVFGGMILPPGYSVDQRVRIAERIETQIDPYAKADLDDPASLASLAPIPTWGGPPFGPVPVENYFIGTFGGFMFVGGSSQDPDAVIPMGALLTDAMNSIPDAMGFASQASIFQSSGGNTIDIEVSGSNLEDVERASGMMFNLAAGEYGYGKVQPDPSNFNLPQQEWRVTLNDLGRELGLRTGAVGTAVRGLFDGAFVGDFVLEGENVDMVLLPRGGRLEHKEQVADVPVATPVGPVVPMGTVVDVTPGLAPQSILRIEELPSVRIRVTPPTGRALQDVMDEIDERVVGPARAAGLVTPGMRVRLEGTAAKLDEVKAALFGSPGATHEPASVRRGATGLALLLVGVGGVVGLLVMVRSVRRRRWSLLYGVAGIVLLAGIAATLVYGFGHEPQLVMARSVWAVVVVYLLMCALFESFLYPLVILFTVPLAVVGGFAGLRIVHDITAANPVRAAQQLDVLTMLGFVILVGVVVNNAILIVHQALNFMRGHADLGHEGAMGAKEAIAESVRSRIRPIAISTTTSVGGMLPLVVNPGAGSEMYRGLGSVVIGGLLLAGLVTLVLVPLVLSLVMEMSESLRLALGRSGGSLES